MIGGAARVGDQRVDQRLAREDVVAHGDERALGIVRQRRGARRLLLEADDPPRLIHAEHAELAGVLQGHRPGGDRRVGARLLMEGEHLVHVHPVDVIGAEDGDDVGVEVVDQVQVLEHRVGGAPVPRGAHSHLRRHDRHEEVREHAARAPGQPQVLDQRLGLVLHEDVERRHVRVHEVREYEVDQTVAAAERDRRLRALARERLQAVTTAAGHDHREQARAPRHRAQCAAGAPRPHAGSRSGKQKSSRSSRRSVSAASDERVSPASSARAISQSRLNSA